MADCDNDQECEKIVPTPIKPEPLPKQCSGGDESGGGTNDFNELDNRPKYGGVEMTGSTNIPNLSTVVEQLGTDVSGIKGVIPEEATAENQLADKQYVDNAAGGGGVKVLTSADFNYPTNNPSLIALWLLDEGQYVIAPHTNYVALRNGSSYNASNQVSVMVYVKPTDSYRGAYATNNTNQALSYLYFQVDKNGDNGVEYRWITYVIDSLNNNNSDNALSAKQGKVLNEKITPSAASGVPTTATEGILGKIYIDTDTDTAYMCTKVDNGSYTWKQITA